MSYCSALNIPDCHIPWHDQKAWDIMIDVALGHVKDHGPFKEINIMGDFLDFFWFGLHPKMPGQMGIKETLKDEIFQGIEKLQELRRLFPESKITFIEGNHEYRMCRYIVKKCPELFDLFTVESLLQLDKMDIDFIPFGKAQLYRCLDTDYILRHQPFNGGKHCAAGSIDAKHISLGFGHTHRVQSIVVTDGLGNEIEAHSMGWLGDRNAPVFDYMDTDNWAQAFQIVHQIGTWWYPQTIRIINHRAVYNGTLYESPTREAGKDR